jgi:thiamine biosynthesis lipoprotein
MHRLILLFLLLLTGCGREPVQQAQSYVFGTLVEVSIYGESEARATQLTGHILGEFQRMHETLHAWRPASELSRINAAFAAGMAVETTPEVAAMITDAAAISAQSGGLFNPAIGNLIQLWGFQSDEFMPVRPELQHINELVTAQPSMTDIVIDGNRVSSLNKAVRLDLGGYAKGYALDQAAAYLRNEKVQGALVNIGGNILAIGAHGERHWRVGIQHPRQPGPIAILDLPDGWAIGTSGDYQRYFELDGKRYCHVIDPRSGWPVQGVQAVTVLLPPGSQAGTRSDTDSKPLFINAANWRESAWRMGLEHVLLIDGQGKVHITEAMHRRLQFTDKHVALEILP